MMRLDKELMARYPDFSRSRITGLIRAGFVRVNGVVATKQGMKIQSDDTLDVTIPPPVPAIPAPEEMPLDVLFEDEDILVINKEAGLVVHPAPGHQTGTLVNALLAHCPHLQGIGGVARPGLVHRLDQDTSGVMVIAKSERAMASLVHAFSTHRDIRKTYLALVHGVLLPSAGRIENLIGRSPFDRKKMAIVARHGKQAITNYRAREGAKMGLSLVECDIETGRTHQIRVHMMSLGHPIVGDGVYGFSRLDRQLDPPPTRQLLHAARLAFRHPATGQEVVFTAPLPEDFRPYLTDAAWRDSIRR